MKVEETCKLSSVFGQSQVFATAPYTFSQNENEKMTLQHVTGNVMLQTNLPGSFWNVAVQIT